MIYKRNSGKYFDILEGVRNFRSSYPEPFPRAWFCYYYYYFVKDFLPK